MRRKGPAYVKGRKNRPYAKQDRNFNQMDKTKLEDKLKALDRKIAEVKKRMPAHSVKPPIMMELFELEDERDELEKRIIQLEKRKE